MPKPLEPKEPARPTSWMAWKLAMTELHLAKLAMAVRDTGGVGNVDVIRKQTVEEFLNRMIPNGVGLGPTKVVVPE